MATFEEFLTKKRIDIALFAQNKPQEWAEYLALYEKMGEKSFDHQKKFFFNPLRAMFPLKTPIPQPEKKKAAILNENAAATSLGAKKMPVKMKPVAVPQKEEETAILKEETTAPPPSVKKMPLKIKPILKTENVEEKTEVAENQAEIASPPPPSVKKMPMKMKPILQTENVEEKTEVAENQAEIASLPPPSVKKMPMKIKPILPPTPEKNAEDKELNS